MYRGLLVAVAGLVLVALPVGAQQDPHLGKWKMNVAKSKFDPGPPPQSVTRTYVVFEGDGLTMTNDTVQADGTRITGGYSAHFDGKDYPAKGMRADTVALKRIDANSYEGTLKNAGKVRTTITNVVSKDGKTLTSTRKGTNASGQPVHDVTVWDRQ